ncbi:integrase [Bosea sp. BE125]|uniref:tyrosine-type recombinase/integrase n=1 Tax=Bosea sp. BE125 TaxID=2817909 RepID=UPI00285CE65F|nr:site-specific integrase [Bosea sp. BE125]MDR6871117.1 integrase [Bosea sp. BE125]
MPVLRAPNASLYTQGGQRKYLTAAERARFLDAAEQCARPEVKTLCLTLAYTGCRISEALALQVGQVGMDSGLIAIRSLKKRSRTIVMREVPVPNELLVMLDAVHGVSTRNADACLWHWSRSRAWQLVKQVMVEAGIPSGIHATPKGLRHGFGLHAVNSGVPLNLVQRWLGHASMTTTAIYLQAMGEEERIIAARMWM